jgi:small subunit ribosomal protein S6
VVNFARSGTFLYPLRALYIVPFRSWLTYGIEREQTHGKEVSLMRNYELVCIVQPDLDETAFNETVDRVKGWVTDAGGTVDKVDVWGKRKLAYLIRKQREGQYVLLNLSLPAEAIADLDRKIRFLEPVMRYMVTAVQ